jgi:hypothetical protein
MSITPQTDTDTRSADLRPSAGPSPIARLFRFLDRLVTNGFFGKIVISFQNGKVCDVRIEQNKKLDEL